MLQMLPTFSPPHFSFDVNLGQVMLVGVLTLLGWGLKQIHKTIINFLTRVDDNESLLNLTTEVIDEQSKALIRAGILKPPVLKLHRSGRRQEDYTFFTHQQEDDAS